MVNLSRVPDSSLILDEEMRKRVDVVWGMQHDVLDDLVRGRVEAGYILCADDVHFEHFVCLVRPCQQRRGSVGPSEQDAIERSDLGLRAQRVLVDLLSRNWTEGRDLQFGPSEHRRVERNVVDSRWRSGNLEGSVSTGALSASVS
jgi:hypothetical protein